jgi:hypothetical protein
LVSRAWDIYSGIGPASHWLEDCANFTPTPEENDKYSAERFVRYKQQANTPLSMNNYIPLVVSMNDKNKPLTVPLN